jgi:hypothetical protein
LRCESSGHETQDENESENFLEKKESGKNFPPTKLKVTIQQGPVEPGGTKHCLGSLLYILK